MTTPVKYKPGLSGIWISSPYIGLVTERSARRSIGNTFRIRSTSVHPHQIHCQIIYLIQIPPASAGDEGVSSLKSRLLLLESLKVD